MHSVARVAPEKQLHHCLPHPLNGEIFEVTKMPKRRDLTGQKFNELTVLRFSHANSNAHWECLCSCGAVVVVKSWNLLSGNTKSCGHLQTAAKTLHGMCETRTYISWKAMISRCTNANNKDFKHYGGRGITVCDTWKVFDRFLADMGERPDGTSLDRIDNTLGYFAENCRWATRSQQARNTRSNRLITHNGVTATAAEWVETTNTGKSAMYNRIRAGWTDSEIINTGYHKRPPRK